MARERYLLGVNPEELVRNPVSTEPPTPRGWWANFWYHYKWTVIVGGALVMAVLVFVWQAATRVKPDYLICMVTTQEVSVEVDEQLEETLTAFAKERNGDGKIRVEVQCLNIANTVDGAANPEAMTNQQAVMAHILSRDVTLWAIDPSYYHGTLSKAFEGSPESFFIPLDTLAETVNGVSDNRAYWDWTGSPVIAAEESLKSLPKTLYWGVRVLPSKPTEEQRTEVNDMLSFLQRFAEAQSK